MDLDVTLGQVREWIAQAEQQDEDLFTQANIEEQIRLFKMHEQNQISDVVEEDRGEGFYKLFSLHGKNKEVQVKTFNGYNDAFVAFNSCTMSKCLT